MTTKTKGAGKQWKDPRAGTMALWIETPFGPLYPCIRPPHTVAEGDPQTLQVRARRREYLEHFRTRWCPDAGPVLSGEEVTGRRTDYPWRCYVSPDALALAVGRMILAIDSEKFKPLVDGPEGLRGKGSAPLRSRLHSVYNGCWNRQLDLSDGTSSYDRPTQLCSYSDPDPDAPAWLCRDYGHDFMAYRGKGKARKRTCRDCGATATPAGALSYPAR